MAIKLIPIGDGVALNSAYHPKGPPLKRGRPTKERAAAKKAAFVEVEVELDKAALAKSPGLKIKSKRAPNGTFDRAAYQRELMRKRRTAEKERREGEK